MTFFFPPHAAATPCLALVTLVPTLALSIGTQAHRANRGGAVVSEPVVASAGVLRVPHGESACNGQDTLLPENHTA